MTEFEKKIMLTRAEYDFLTDHYVTDGCLIHQINYYYDTDDYDMNSQHVTCRIRESGGRCISTIKAHNCMNRDYSQENSRIVRDQWDSSRFDLLGLKFQGILTTYRTKTTPEYGIEVMVDRNLYLDSEDYELEIEYFEACENCALLYIIDLAKELEHNGIISNRLSFIKRIGKGKRKSERFFDRKRNLKQR